METVVGVDLDGNLTYLVNEVSAGAFPDAQRPCRASYIEPWGISLRLLFRALRKAFGDDSAVAAWTRRWPCRWILDLSPVGGPGYKEFCCRRHAIEFEIEWLNENFL